MSKFIQPLQLRAGAIIVAAIITSVGVGPISSVHAQGSDGDKKSSTIDRQTTPSTDESQNRLRVQQQEALEAKKAEAKEAAEAKLRARHEARQQKLSASQLEICKSREQNINNRIARIADRSTKHLELFTTISERAQTFYIDKGNALDNYDELVADVTMKKVAAEAAVASIADTSASFDCEGENPKVTIEEFKTSLKSAIDVLKEYRTSVKNLIVGIKSVNTVTSDNSSQPTDQAE